MNTIKSLVGMVATEAYEDEPADEGPRTWDASHIKQPGWHHVQAAFIEGAREAKANPECADDDIRRAADGYTKRVFEEVDPVSEAALRTESWAEAGGSPLRCMHCGYPASTSCQSCGEPLL